MAITSTLAILFTVTVVTVKQCYAISASEQYNGTSDKVNAFHWSIDSIAKKSFLIASNNPAKATLLADSLISKSILRDDDYGVAVGYILKGQSFERRTNNDSAFYYFFQCLKLLEHENYPQIKSEALFNIGDLHEVTGHYDSAAFYIFSSLHIADSLADADLQAKNLRIVGNLMYKQGRFDLALQYYFLSLKNFRINNSFASLDARTQENIALTYIKQDSNNLAEKYFQNANFVYEQDSDERGKARVNLNWAMLRIKQGLFNEAIKRTGNALQFYLKIKHHNGIAECYMTLAEAYLHQKKYSEAQKYAELLLDEIKMYEDKDLENVGFNILQQVCYAEGDIEKAYYYQAKSIKLYTDIYNESKDAVVTELLVRYNLNKAEQQAKQLKEQNEINILQIFRQKQQAMWLTLAIVLLVIIAALIVYILRMSQKHKVQQTRIQISSDLHDDLGSNLSKISLLTEVMKSHTQNATDKSELEKISQSSHEALEKMSEIVWSLNPKNDRIANLVAYIRRYAMEYFEPTTIECRISIPDAIPDKMITGTVRRNIFLVIKELLHNIVKHANATLVEINIDVTEKHFNVIVHDNGIGKDTPAFQNAVTENSFKGNGIINMKNRMKEIGGSLLIEFTNGTTAQLALQLR